MVRFKKGEHMKTYYLGIDVSKGYADFVFLDSEKTKVEPDFQLDDTFIGHHTLFDRICAFIKDHPGSQIHAAVESTGGYENNWLNNMTRWQAQLQIQVARLNPVGVSANSKADLSRNITDALSAKNVAVYMISHPEKVSFFSEDPLYGLKRQWKFVRLLTKQSTQLFNQLESVVYTANPEILFYCRDGFPEWVLKVLGKYPVAKKLSQAKYKALAKIPYVSEDRAKELIARAKKSIGSAQDQVMENLIVSIVKQLLHLKQIIRDQNKILEKQCPTIAEIDILQSFKGISTFSAVGLMLEIQSVARFSTVKKLAAHFGLHPAVKTSGDGSKKVRMSKKGRKEPRHILYMVTLSAVQCNPLIKEIYEERLEKGMAKMAAIGYCMHKILRIIYGMLKHNRPFDPAIDRKNREREKNRRQRIRKNKNRSYQDFDPHAPISRRQNKKRKERKLSQSDNIVEYGIGSSALD
jgi:transposase